MTFVPALALVTLLASGDPLSEAQRAFSQGQYPEAEALARQAARPPTQGTALYLVGLARFRAGRPAEALEALEAAALAEDAPPKAAWSFNRGACLYALGRFEEAEAAFAAAEEDPELAQAARVNAGFAALDAGSPERAAQWADRAAPGASEQVALQVEELRTLVTEARGGTLSEAAEAYRQGLAAFDAERFDEARALFLRSAALDPGSGRARLMAGASAWRQGARAVAREDVTASLSLPLEPQDRNTAHQYLDRLSFGLRASGPGARLSVQGGLGFDSNVPQYGVAERDFSRTETETASPFADVGLGVALRLRLSDALFAHLFYGGSQRAYSQDSLEDYALQLHRVSAAVEWEAARRVRVGGSVSGDVFFTGLSDFRGLQSSVGGGAWLAFDAHERTSTRLDVSLARKDGLISEFSYLTGTRLDATLSQELRVPALNATAWYRYRQDRIGTLVQDVSTTGQTQAYVIPFAWAGHAAGTSWRLAPIGRFDASLDAEVERRFYREDSYLSVQLPDGSGEEWGRRRRRDTRFLLGSTVSARLTELLHLSARYELLVNHSNVDTRLPDDAGACLAPGRPCHLYDYTNGNYQKHVLTLELGASW
jgi:tetratricopeptide (TPR) repeat protein